MTHKPEYIIGQDNVDEFFNNGEYKFLRTLGADQEDYWRSMYEGDGVIVIEHVHLTEDRDDYLLVVPKNMITE